MVLSRDGFVHHCHGVEDGRSGEMCETLALMSVYSCSLVVEKTYPWFRARKDRFIFPTPRRSGAQAEIFLGQRVAQRICFRMAEPQMQMTPPAFRVLEPT